MNLIRYDMMRYSIQLKTSDLAFINLESFLTAATDV